MKPDDARHAVVARRREDVVSLRAEWKAFLDRHGELTLDASPDFFLGTLDWLDSNPEPYVALLGDAAHTRALIVARTRKHRLPLGIRYVRIQSPRLRCLEVVYGGIITDGTPESEEWVVEHLEGVLASGEIELVAISHLPSEHCLSKTLLAKRSCSRTSPIQRDRHWYSRLLDPESGERVVPHSGKNRRRQRRYDKSLLRHFDGEVEIRRTTDAEEVPLFITKASAIARKSYHEALGVGVQDSPRWDRMLRHLARLGMLRAYLLVAKDEPIAYEVAAAFGHHCTLIVQSFLPAYQKFKPGNYLIRSVFDSLADEGIETVDFGFGDSVHKAQHGTHWREEVSVRLYGRGVRSTLAWAMDWSSTSISNLLRKLMDSLGILNTVKNRWRARLQSKAASGG